ncbi:MAG: hypothetical protein R3E96_05280 [Planctomycetota bacterium]
MHRSRGLETRWRPLPPGRGGLRVEGGTRDADEGAGQRPGLRVKFGMDPSSPDLHISHSIPLLKLRDLQRLGRRWC